MDFERAKRWEKLKVKQRVRRSVKSKRMDSDLVKRLVRQKRWGFGTVRMTVIQMDLLTD